MAFTEEKEAGKNESKQSNNTDEILKIISNSESKRLDLSRRHIEDVPIEMKSLRKLEVICKRMQLFLLETTVKILKFLILLKFLKFLEVLLTVYLFEFQI